MALDKLKFCFKYFSWKKLHKICESFCVESVTFGHFSDVSWMGVPFVTSLTAFVARRTIWLLSLLACVYQRYVQSVKSCGFSW